MNKSKAEITIDVKNKFFKVYVANKAIELTNVLDEDNISGDLIF